MQTIVSIIDRKTNMQVCRAIINLTNIDESNLSPAGIFGYIWENVLEHEILGDRKDYLIHLFNKRNHITSLLEPCGITPITAIAKISCYKGSVICLQDYKNYKLRKYAC